MLSRGGVALSLSNSCFQRVGCRKNKSYAFTLAEILITLGIIGVVAAITIPILFANYQKKLLVTQLKKTYTLLNENYRLTLAKEGCTDAISCGFMEVTGVSMGPYGTWAGGANFDLDISYSPSFYSKLASNIKLGDAFVMPPNAEDMSPEEQQSFIEANMNTILKYANHSIKSMDKTKDYFPFASVAYLGTTPDGAYIGIFLPDFYIDVNGVKGPNILGRDVFVFSIIVSFNLSLGNELGIRGLPFEYIEAIFTVKVR